MVLTETECPADARTAHGLIQFAVCSRCSDLTLAVSLSRLSSFLIVSTWTIPLEKTGAMALKSGGTVSGGRSRTPRN